MRQTAKTSIPEIQLLSSPEWKDYELLDSGNGLKLERFGSYRLVRPEAEAIWRPALPDEDWKSAQSVFTPSAEENGGHWSSTQAFPERWKMEYKGLKFWAQTTASRHLGVFPEQASQWDWIEKQIRAADHPMQVLNLFGYTGLASLAAARAGAKVTHLDASHKVVSWAKENQELSGLSERPIRWIVDDAVKFVQREGRRGTQYDGLILDPPKFGRGPKGEVWEFYKLMPMLLQACREILSPSPSFMALTAYAVKASALTLFYAVEEMMQGKGGSTTAGEVVLQEKSAGRLLSMAIYARWSNGG
ncbi:MAG: class I SAM-dependent methyltransferase [Anaerolineaceae bacterium]|nr:class I SAM-dependent methyltransferase [Anaerolineaceae bacterium]